MPRGHATFRHADVVRAVKAVRAAGLEVERTEIGRDGRIVLIHRAAAMSDDSDAALQTWRAKKHGANSA